MELTLESAPELWSRFGGFHDGVIRSIELRPETWTARVDLDAADITDNMTWHRVQFEFEGLREWRLEQIRSDMVVIFEAKTAEADGFIFVNFDAATLPEEPVADDFRATDAYFAARAVRVTTRPLWGYSRTLAQASADLRRRSLERKAIWDHCPGYG